MIKPCATPALLMLLAGCQPDQPATTATHLAPPAPPAVVHAGPADTLHVVDSLGRRVGMLRLRPSSQAAFEKLLPGPLPAQR